MPLYRLQGCQEFHISTQLDNTVAQNTRSSEGFRLQRAEITVHVNMTEQHRIVKSLSE